MEELLRAFAFHIPFENLDVMNKEKRSLSEDNLADKILIQQRGGLCYELNPLLHRFLKEAGFDAKLVKGTVYNNEKDQWALDGTHLTIIVKNASGMFLVDAGFGTSIPLKPVPFSGEPVHSESGVFRVSRQQTEKGTYLLEQKNEEGSWIKAYAFSDIEIQHVQDELESVQKEIHDNPASPFNKRQLIAKRIPEGKIVLSEDHLLIEKAGQQEKRPVESGLLSDILKEQFYMNVKR
nr:arylamine N-acetyltransferase [Metabacillus kandeliae]